MELKLATFLLVCPLVFLAGFVDAIGGGGGLISLPAYLLAGVPVHFALATNKMSSASGTLISTVRICRSIKIRWKLAIPAVACALAGSYIGTRLSLLTDEKILRYVLIVVLPVVAFFVLRKNSLVSEKAKRLDEKKEMAVSWISAFLIGIYDGFYGPGTGTFYLLILTGIAHLNVHQASAMTKILNLTSNLVALINFLLNGTTYYGLGMAAAVFCIAGNYIGSGLVVSNGQKIVRPLILVVLVVLFVKIVTGI